MSDSGTPRIVVGVDGTPSSLAAAEWAAEVAHRDGVGLRLVAAFVTLTDLYPGPAAPEWPAQLHDHPRDVAGSTLRSALYSLLRHHRRLDVDTVVRHGDPASVLSEESRRAVMTVVGSRTCHQLTQVVLGSVAARVAAHAFGPVVVVRGQATPPRPPGRVVAGIDASALAPAVLGFAFEEAARRAAELIVVHCWDPRPLARALAGVPVPVPVAALAVQESGWLTSQLATWQARFPDVRTQQRLLVGSPSRGLQDLSHSVDGSTPLVVVGSRGRGGFAGLLMGSTSAHLVAHSHCPVAVIHGLPPATNPEDAHRSPAVADGAD